MCRYRPLPVSETDGWSRGCDRFKPVYAGRVGRVWGDGRGETSAVVLAGRSGRAGAGPRTGTRDARAGNGGIRAGRRGQLGRWALARLLVSNRCGLSCVCQIIKEEDGQGMSVMDR